MIPARAALLDNDMRLRAAIQSVIRETRGFNERKQEAWCKVCRYRDPLHTKLHDSDCPIYELHDAWEKWEAALALLRSEAAQEPPVRRFTNKDGFADDSDYVEIVDGRSWVVRKNGTRWEYAHYSLAQCLEHVASGSWHEIPVAAPAPPEGTPTLGDA